MTAASVDSSVRKFRNTFDPDCQSRYLTAGQLFCGLRYGAWEMKDLPEDAREAVGEISDRVYGKK